MEIGADFMKSGPDEKATGRGLQANEIWSTSHQNFTVHLPCS